MKTLRVLWLEDFSGTTNQHSSPFLLQENQNQISVNMSQLMDGALAHRLGSKLFLNSLDATAPVRGLHMQQKTDGTNYLHMVTLGNIYSYADGAGSWTLQESSIYNTASTIEMDNFNGLHYLTSSRSGEYLRKIDSSGASTVVSGNIAGKYVAVSGAYLMVSADPSNTQRNYFSNVGNDTFTTTIDYFDCAGAVTGLASFGDGRPFVSFTSNNYLIIDPANEYSAQSNSNGLVNHRSIQNVNGSLIFLDYDGWYLLDQNQSRPVDISLALKNTLTGNAIFNQINSANYGIIASGTIENRYYCALGNLRTAVKGQTLNNCVVEYDTDQKTWKVHTFGANDIGGVFTKYVSLINGLQLFSGSFSSGTVYQLEYPNTYTDDNTAGSPQVITSVLRTKAYQFSSRYVGSETLKKLNRLHFRYYATSPITVKYSLDGATTYTTLPATLPAYTATEWNHDFLYFGKECKTCSLEISCSGNFYIYGIGFDAENRDIYGIKGE